MGCRNIGGVIRAASIFGVVVAGCLAGGALAQDSEPPDAAAIRSHVEALAAYLDSDEYAAKTTWAEHVVLAYQVAQGREPTALAFETLARLHAAEGLLPRSQVLALALCGEEDELTWEQCRAFAAKGGVDQFQVTSATKAVARRLDVEAPVAVEKALADTLFDALNAGPCDPKQDWPDPGPANEVYNTYFGFLHAHSTLSDGAGPALEAYTYARDEGGMDFFSLADHGELLMVWPWEFKWRQLKDAAEQLYDPGAFVTLWGFEWSSPVFGHIAVTNSSQSTNAVFCPTMGAFFFWLRTQSSAFATFNHPGEYDDFGTEFDHLRCNSGARDQMVGIECWNNYQSFEMYYYAGSWENDFSYYDVGNRNGWYLGASGAEDNHYTDWGTRTQFRVAVLAKELTREAIVDAYKKRRFYTTEDKDVFLDFRCAGYPMGSRLTNEPRVFVVTASDGGGDTFGLVRLFRNGELIESRDVTGNSFETTFTDASGGAADYYYVIVTQTDDSYGFDSRMDEAISSPIWFNEPWACASGCVGVAAPTAGIPGPANGVGGGLLMALTLVLLVFISNFPFAKVISRASSIV